MASPPKPWEMAGASIPGSVHSPNIGNPTTSTSTSSLSNPPELPERPSSLAASVNQNAAAYSRMGASPYGGGFGTTYSSPYSTPFANMGGYGGYGSGMYGGGFGNMYGGGMYGGMPGMMGQDPNNPNSLTNSFNQSTAATFQMLEGIVNAFGGFAQMLQSTYMATHSSFYVAEQFGNLRDTLGSILGIFALLRWIRTLFAKLTGRPPPADAMALTPAAFARFEGRQAGPNGAPAGPPRASRKPLFFFILAAFGLPYVMSKVIRTLAASHEEEERKRLAATQIDPSKLEYCRVTYDYPPKGAAAQGGDLQVQKGDLVAVLDKADPFGTPSQWWRCRTKDSRMGYLPSTYLEKLNVKLPQQPVAAIKATAASDSSRANSLTTSSGGTVETIPGPPTPVAMDMERNPDFKTATGNMFSGTTPPMEMSMRKTKFMAGE